MFRKPTLKDFKGKTNWIFRFPGKWQSYIFLTFGPWAPSNPGRPSFPFSPFSPGSPWNSNEHILLADIKLCDSQIVKETYGQVVNMVKAWKSVGSSPIMFVWHALDQDIELKILHCESTRLPNECVLANKQEVGDWS